MYLKREWVEGVDGRRQGEGRVGEGEKRRKGEKDG
jgi:hypothetical protein